MGDITAAELARVNSFPKLVDLLRDRLEWPIHDYDFDDVVFEYEAKDLGLKESEIAKIREIHQLRPLVTNQPWGVFFLSLEDRAISVAVLRRMLRALVVRKRAGAQSADRQAWDKHDLIFAANFGKSEERELAFVHFSDGEGKNDLPVMKVLGWNARDTKLHNEHVAKMLREKLSWPDDPEDQKAWRESWSSAFETGLNEVIRTSKDLAIRLAALAVEIRARANQLLAAETDTGPMRTMLEAFRKNLIDNLDEDGFADMFAQTICYGMLAARISRPGALLVADNMADMVPKTNPFLKELFESFLKLGGRDKRKGMDFDELGVREVVDMLNCANMDAVLRDFGDRNPKEDPIIHFYELFLKEYDPKKRMQRGVFYTPRPVVNFIVRGVDEILREEFGLPLGLADTTTWRELAAKNDKITIPGHVDPDTAFVQILDPATGTGTFLVEAIDLIYGRMVDHWESEGRTKVEIAEAWNAYVPKHLLPRLTAFELMMAPYSIAHMKVGLKLTETGYRFGSDVRARIFLTNALEPARDLDMEFIFMAEALAHEAQAANDAKSKTPFTVVVGNPPYSVSSQNKDPWIVRLCSDFKSGLEGEINLQPLSDDYIKFIRRSVDDIDKVSAGVFGMVTNKEFTRGALFRSVRHRIHRSFGEIEVYDLYDCDIKDAENENVFDIKKEVCITLARTSNERAVRFVGFSGSREHKFNLLLKHSRGYFNFYEVTASGKYCPFRPTRSEYFSEYENYAEVNEFFSIDAKTGFATHRDDFAIHMSEDDARSVINDIGDYGISVTDLISKYSLKATRDWKPSARLQSARTKGSESLRIARCSYRPFDYRYVIYDSDIVEYPRREHLRNVDGQIGIIISRYAKCEDYRHVFAVDNIVEKIFISALSSNNAYIFPLWLKADAGEILRRPNIDRTFALGFGKAIGLAYEDGITRGQQVSMGAEFGSVEAKRLSLEQVTWEGRGDLTENFGPRDSFDWIYAVLHSPSYRARYAEFLKSDFPRIPTPGSRGLFKALVPLGRELMALHLLRPDEAPVLNNPEIRFAGHGEARVEKGHPYYENGKVMINGSRWFEDVPRETWKFHVGGYQVCEKWLKDRAAKGGKNPSPGRVLTEEDTLHYRRIVMALTETRRLMVEIDRAIEEHGGWPGAFRVDVKAELEPV